MFLLLLLIATTLTNAFEYAGIRGSDKLKMTDFNVDITLHGIVAHVVLHQTYVLDEDYHHEDLTYKFPMDINSAFYNFTLIINDDIRMEGRVREKQQARKEYEEAIEQGKVAALAEQDSEDVFAMDLGNTKSGDKIVVIIKYSTIMKVQDNAYLLYIPTQIAPRYSPEGGCVYNNMWSGGFNVKLTAIHPQPNDITCTMSGIECETRQNSKEFTVNDFTSDVIFKISSSSIDKPQLLTECNDKDCAYMISFMPNYKPQQQITEMEYIFIMDRSGSMEYNMDLLRAMMTAFLQELPQNALFNIVSFGSTYQLLFPSAVPYNDDNLIKAHILFQKMDADLGGTELQQPLQTLFNTPTELYRNVFVLTDGEITNTYAILDMVRQHTFGGKTRVFSVGIGPHVSHHLVDGLAQAGKGSCFYCELSVNCSGHVHQLMKSAKQGYLIPEITWSSEGEEVHSYVPHTISPNEVFTAFALVPKDADDEIEFVVKTQDGTVIYDQVAYPLVDFFAHNTNHLHAIVAKQIVSHSTSQEIITKLALDNNIVSKYTSFVAISPKHRNGWQPLDGGILMDLSGTSLSDSVVKDSNVFTLVGGTGPYNNYEDDCKERTNELKTTPQLLLDAEVLSSYLEDCMPIDFHGHALYKFDEELTWLILGCDQKLIETFKPEIQIAERYAWENTLLYFIIEHMPDMPKDELDFISAYLPRVQELLPHVPDLLQHACGL